ncbi:hypothetical protein [Pseudomonas sp. PA1(2017)]|uniref:hypothetical protein n=1 Tax=Pseudomonas sp. PA1(2017) TaxID=1932113 RepID=UPI0011151586|nr:hypothetical protein [Pseudomonas sp. PA1(2017)]
MRVEIYPEDLYDDRSGFRLMAKKIHRGWRGPKPFSPSDARDLLSRAFGYWDYQHVQAVARTKSGTPSYISRGDLATLLLDHIVSVYGKDGVPNLFGFVGSLPYSLQVVGKRF